MQEEVTSKTIALAIKTAKLDGKVLQAALRQFMQLYRKKRDTPHRGKQMLKAEILFNDITITPETGTPQGGFYPHCWQM